MSSLQVSQRVNAHEPMSPRSPLAGPSALSSVSVDGILHLIVGSLLTFLLHGALWAGAWTMTGALPASLGLGDRFLATFSLALFQAVGITLGAAALGLLTPVVVGTISAAVSTALVWIARWVRRGRAADRARAPSPPQLGRAIADAVGEFRVSDPVTPVAAVPGVAFFLLLFLHAVPRPPMGFDPLNYHLTIAATAIQTHGFPIVFLPPYFDLYAWFPANGAVFSIWMLLWMGCDLWLAFVNVPFLAALAVSLYLLARDLGLERAPSVALTSAFLTVPMVAMLATESYVEVPLWAMFFVALRFALTSARENPGAFPIVAGLCGVMAGTKTVGLVLAFLAFAVHASVAFRPDLASVRVLLRRASCVLAGFLIFGSFFYIRNYIESGNPIYPVPVRVFGHEVFSGQTDLDSRLAATTVAAHLDFLWGSGRLLRAFLGEVFTPNASWGLGPTGLVAILLGLPFGLKALANRAHRPASALFVAGVLVLVAWFYLPYGGKFLFSNVRFAFPGAVLLGLVAASGLAGVLPSRPARSVRPTHLALTSGIVLLQASSFFFTNVPVSTTAGVAAAALAVTAGLAVLVRRLADDRNLSVKVFRLPASRPRRGLVLAGALGVALFAVARWHDTRERGRIASYRDATEPYQLQVAEYADCLAAVERLAPRGRLAVALEAHRRGFLFPLFGSHLQREVLYVHNGPEDSRLHSDYPYGNPRLRPDLDAWLRHLAQASPDALLVFLDPVEGVIPIESHWASARRDLFRLEFRSDRCELHRIDKRGLVGYR